MGFRIQVSVKEKADQEKRARHAKLNEEATQMLKKHNGKEQWERDLIYKLESTSDRDTNIMMIPVLEKRSGQVPRESEKTP